jgi:hypothetical protein
VNTSLRLDIGVYKTVMRSISHPSRFLCLLLAALGVAVSGARGQTATDIYGLYYTGLNSSSHLQTSGGTDANWSVTYASTNGGASASTANEGAAYVISPAQISGSGYTPDTTTAQWITAKGATLSDGSAPNTGGDFLPGNGNMGSNEGIYLYTLAFQISGTGGNGTVVDPALSKIVITMTLAADDQYSVYINPTGNGTSIPTGTAVASQTSAWSNKTQITIQSGGTGNPQFVIGTNYLVIAVDNTNSVTGSSTSTAANASGLLVFQTSNSTINGHPVPEVATWLPLMGALGCYGLVVLRRRQAQGKPVLA